MGHGCEENLDRYRVSLDDDSQTLIYADALKWTRKLAGGVRKDIQMRLPFYKSDWTEAFAALHRQKAVASVLFLFFACLAPAIAFGTLFNDYTGGQLGVVEMILSSAVSGVAYSFVAGQPLCILGATGPELAYTVVFFNWCEILDLEFLPARFWQGMWTALITVALACSDVSCLMSYVTRFTEEIFAALICIIFIVEAVLPVITSFSTNTLDASFMSALLCFGTFMFAMALRNIKMTSLMVPSARRLISNFGVTISIFVCAALAAIWRNVPIDYLDIPTPSKGGLAPTWVNPATNATRAWVVPPLGYNKAFPVWGIFFTFIPALGLALLGYLDQNLTTLLINRKSSGLRKPPGYHLDLLMCGIFVYPMCSILGLPFTHAATVRSLTHLISVTHYEQVEMPGGGPRQVVVAVGEQRVTNLCIHILIGCSLALSVYLTYIPKAVLFGVFMYMGVTAMPGNQLFERIFLWGIWDRENYPKYRYVTRVPFKKMHLFTVIQVVLLVILYILKSISTIAVVFPFFIGALAFVRIGIGRLGWFTKEELEELDNEEDLLHDDLPLDLTREIAREEEAIATEIAAESFADHLRHEGSIELRSMADAVHVVEERESAAEAAGAQGEQQQQQQHSRHHFHHHHGEGEYARLPEDVPHLSGGGGSGGGAGAGAGGGSGSGGAGGGGSGSGGAGAGAAGAGGGSAAGSAEVGGGGGGGDGGEEA